MGFVGGPPCGGGPAGCTNGAAFGSGTIPTNNTVITLTTCAFAGEYSTVFGAVSGQTLQFTATASYSPVYLTVHSGTFNGPIVAAGPSPLTFANTFTGTLFLHYNTNSSCGTLSVCHTGTVQCTSCPPPAAANDLCTGATTITCGSTTTGNTTGAGTDATVCNAFSSPGLWYVFTSTVTGNATVSLCGSSYDTWVSAYSGTCAALTCLGQNDDFCGLQSQLTFPVTNGTQYRILVNGFSSNAGAFTMSLTCTSSGGAPNDLCAGAIPIVCGSTTTGNTTGAGADANACGGALSPGLWYKITPATNIGITLSLCGSAYDTRISVYSGSCAGTMVACNDDAASGPCAFTLQSEVTFPATGGVTYFILVNGFSTNFGAFTMSATCAAVFDPCAGIVASNACGIPNTTVVPSGTGAWAFGSFLPPGKESIYTFTPATTGNYTITQNTSTTGTWTDYFFKPVSGGCNNTGWTFIQDMNGNGLTSGGFPMTAGIPYYILLDIEGTGGGTINWQINCSVPAPPNDDCSSAIPLPLIPGSPLTFTGNTVGATNTTDGSFTAFPTVWHAFTLTQCATVTLNYCATSPAFGDVWINLATSCPAFTFTAQANSFTQSCPGGGSNWIIVYNNLPAGTYWVPVLGSEPGFVTPGPYSLTASAVACLPPPPNDACAGALPITCGSTVTGSTIDASNEVGLPCGSANKGVWYTLTIPNSGIVYLSLCGSGYDTWLSMYSGTCGALTCVASNDDAAAGPCAFTLQSYIETPPIPAGTYYVLVAGFGSSSGAFTLETTCALCAATPVGGTASGPSSGCTGSMLTYTVSGASSVQWQSSTTSASGPFTDISGQTSPTLNYTTGAAGTLYIRNNAASAGCTPSGSNVVTTTVAASGGVLTTSATPSANACPGTSVMLNGNFSSGTPSLTITISSAIGAWLDEVEWTVTGGFSGGPYGFGTTNTVTITPSSYPVVFSINSQGNINDNQPTYTVVCNVGPTTLVSGTLGGGQSFTSSPLSCIGAPGSLTSPSWSGPGGFSASGISVPLSVTPTSGGVYTLSGISPTGCPVSSSVTITTLALPVASATSSAPVCDGSSLSLFGDNFAVGQSSGNSYSWIGPNGYSASGQFPTLGSASLLSSGNYVVTVTNAFGCTESATTNVIINPNPVLSVNSVTNASCIGASDGCIDIDASNGASPYLFDYNGNSTLDGIYCGLGAGTYNVTVIDDNGCEGNMNASVIEEDLVDPQITCIPNVTVNNTPNLCSGVATWIGPVGTDNCAGAITSQTGGPVSGSTFPVGITPVTYTVTDAFLNTATCSFNVIVIDNQNPSITCPPDVIVNNDPGFCYATPASLGNPTTGDNCAVLGITNNAPAQFPVGATIVDWEVEDVSGNKSQCQQFVIVQDNENPAIANMPSNIVFTANPTDCTPSIPWTAPTASDNCSISSFTSNYNPGDEFPEGTTTVIYTAIDINGNSVTASFTVTILTQPLVAVTSSTTFQCGYNISCNGGSNGNAAVSISGGCLPYSVVWSNGATTLGISGLSAGNYTATVTDDNGHVTTQSITLTQPPVALSTTLGPDQSYEFACTCATLTPSTSGGSTCQPYAYSWSTGAATTSVTVCPGQTATFTVTVTDINGCTSSDVISILKPATVAQLDQYVVMGLGTTDDNMGNNTQLGTGAIGHRLGAGKLILGNNTGTTYWVAANNVQMGNNNTMPILYRNTATIGSGNVIGSTITPVTIPITAKVPCFPTFSGGLNINVTTTTTLNPGTYNNVTVANGATLILNSGVYNMNSLTTGNTATVQCNGASQPHDVFVFVKTNVIAGNNNVFRINVYAQGMFDMGNTTFGNYRGAFFGKPVKTGNNGFYTLDAYCFSNLPLCTVREIGDETTVAQPGLFNVYPNPSNGMFTVQYTGTTGSVLNISVLNTMGQVVYERKVYEFSGEFVQDFDLHNLSSGIYTIQINNGNELSNKQFVVTH